MLSYEGNLIRIFPVGPSASAIVIEKVYVVFLLTIYVPRPINDAVKVDVTAVIDW